MRSTLGDRHDLGCRASFEVTSLCTRKTEMVESDQALPGRDTPMSGLGPHLVLGTRVYQQGTIAEADPAPHG
jgi:hypothetical protein